MAFIGTSKHTQQYVELIEIALDSQTIPLLWGAPGVGKTALINAIAEKRGMLIRTLIGSTMDPTDVAGLPIITTTPEGQPTTEFALPEWFKEIDTYARTNPQGAILFIDEITTTTPPVQAALLTFIQDRRIGKNYLPKNILIIAAGNPPNQAADGWQLAPPTANRFTHINYTPSIEDWYDGMLTNWGNPTSPKEQQVRNTVVAFLRINRELINKIPDDPEEASGAWPSMRQWDNTARMLGKAKNTNVAELIVRGSVGEEGSREYFTWLKHVAALPDPNQTLQNPHSVPWEQLRADELHLTLISVVELLNQTNYDTVEEALKVAKTKSGKKDVIATVVQLFLKRAKQAHGTDPTVANKMLNTAYELLQ